MFFVLQRSAIYQLLLCISLSDPDLYWKDRCTHGHPVELGRGITMTSVNYGGVKRAKIYTGIAHYHHSITVT